jgi:hypothetical protein
VATELRAYSATIPAGTLQAAPATFDMSFPTRQVDNITVFVPPGNNGTVGFWIANAGVPMIPYNPGGFLVGNNEVIPLPLTDQITSGSWQLIGFNLGQFPHTLYVRFYLSVIPLVAGAAGVPDLAALSSDGGGAGLGGQVAPQTGPQPSVPGPVPVLTNPSPVGGFVGPPPAPLPVGGG